MYGPAGAVLPQAGSSPDAPQSGLPAAVARENGFRVAASGRQAPGPGSLARGTRVRQLQLPPDNATRREHHGRLPPGTLGHLGRRRRLIPVSAPSLHSQLKTGNRFLETEFHERMESWSFLTSHARVLLCIAHDPDARLRDIAASLDITERSAYGIVTDLTAAGYVVKQENGRRNRYQIQAHLRREGEVAGSTCHRCRRLSQCASRRRPMLRSTLTASVAGTLTAANAASCRGARGFRVPGRERRARRFLCRCGSRCSGPRLKP